MTLGSTHMLAHTPHIHRLPRWFYRSNVRFPLQRWSWILQDILDTCESIFLVINYWGDVPSQWARGLHPQQCIGHTLNCLMSYITFKCPARLYQKITGCTWPMYKTLKKSFFFFIARNNPESAVYRRSLWETKLTWNKDMVSKLLYNLFQAFCLLKLQ